jgi:hypothetical protein
VAALSAIVHREEPALEAILEPLARALGTVADEVTAKHYTLIVEAGLETPARREAWRILLSTYFPGGGPLLKQREREIGEEYKAKGLAEGEANAILLVLEGRNVTVTDDVRKRITSCTDMDMLARWLGRVASVGNAEDLFADEAE